MRLRNSHNLIDRRTINGTIPSMKRSRKTQPRLYIGEGHLRLAEELAEILNRKYSSTHHGVHIIRDLIEKAWTKETGKQLPEGLPHKAFHKIEF